MTTKEKLIAQCRYYKGEPQSPFSDSSGRMDWFWDMERVFVESDGRFTGEQDYYKRLNGKSYPGIPFSLLMVMFTSWGKQTYDIKRSIGDFYELIDFYLNIAQTTIRL